MYDAGNQFPPPGIDWIFFQCEHQQPYNCRGGILKGEFPPNKEKYLFRNVSPINIVRQKRKTTGMVRGLRVDSTKQAG